ncbi:MAG: bifunctional diaminohydroxyphosphoribosylaminopyrimidine deaminase/5-amino-6-(5-phosphoribosylamino)uracil reductase RibD [Pseudomonadota bacterium]
MSSASMDERYVAAAIRYARRHMGLTGTNPSVATLIVQHTQAVSVIVGRGVTALGGRPHAERIALDEAGQAARGATAYVTLEPCAHHGVTPPCAQALIDAGVRRVVTAYVDPDARVDGEGHAMLRRAGIEVREGVCSAAAAQDLAGYLTRKRLARPHVHLKLAVSADGRLGCEGQEVAITGEESRAQVHVLRAQTDAILVGAGTLRADDPSLTCRLDGMEHRSPLRVILGGRSQLPLDAKVFMTARDVPTLLVPGVPLAAAMRAKLNSMGVEILGSEPVDGRSPWPELLDDLGARGLSCLFVEGGAAVAQSLLSSGLVDGITLLQGTKRLGADAILSPLTVADLKADSQWQLRDVRHFGPDICHTFERPRVFEPKQENN